MKKLVVFGVLTLALSGCASDERETQIGRAVDEVNKVTSNLSIIRENVEKWAKDPKDTPEKGKYLKAAVERAEKDLRSVAQDMQRTKQAADKLEPLTKEQKDEFIQKYRDSLGRAITKLNQEQEKLNEAIAKAESMNRAALAELKLKLQQAQGEFEVLTKQR